jgi:hypothetical protein
MIGRTSWMTIAALVLAFAACSNPVTSRKPWDDYAGETLKVHGADRATAGQVVWRAVKEQVSVHGREFLAAQGEPDTLEILGGRFSQKTIILYYTRRSAGPPRSIRLDPGKKGFIPRAPELITTGDKARSAPDASGRPRGGRGAERAPQPERAPQSERAPQPERTPQPGRAPQLEQSPQPEPTSTVGPRREFRAPQTQPTTGHGGSTAEQRVNCPIDPTRWDCRALCSPGADYEWCR